MESSASFTEADAEKEPEPLLAGLVGLLEKFPVHLRPTGLWYETVIMADSAYAGGNLFHKNALRWHRSSAPSRL